MTVILRRKHIVKECDAGGVSAPMATANNVGGIGNAVPAQMAAMTAADQCSPSAVGSGDFFGGAAKPATQAGMQKKRKTMRFRKSKHTL